MRRTQLCSDGTTVMRKFLLAYSPLTRDGHFAAEKFAPVRLPDVLIGDTQQVQFLPASCQPCSSHTGHCCSSTHFVA